MKKKYLKILILGLILGFLIWQSNILANFSKNRSTAFAVGDLVIDWGVPSGEPIFVINNFLPGEKVTREILLTNNAGTSRPVGIKGVKTSETGNLDKALILTIFENGNIAFGPKNLASFFEESNSPTGIFLADIQPGESKKYNFEVTFDSFSGNDYQNTSVVFDIIIGVFAPVPEECLGIRFSGPPIFGTQGKDNLKGTSGNDLIFGFEGDDKIDGSNGNDCIIGGPENDYLDDSNGDDVIFGNEGADKIKGSNGDDLIFGGDGEDKAEGSNGNDKIYGGAGNDLLYGGNGNDYLNTGLNNKDYAQGDLGVDTCIATLKKLCEK